MRTTALDEEFTALSHTDAMKALVERLTGDLAVMLEQADATVVAELPDLAGRADEPVRRRVIEATFERVVRRIAGKPRRDSPNRPHHAFGAAAAHAGVPLEQLTAAYRIGARIGWSHIRQAVRDLGLDGEIALLLADAEVAYVDEITSESIEGYTEVMQTTQHRRARQQQSLVDAVMSGRATAEWANPLGWELPTELAVAVLYGDGAADVPATNEVLVGAYDGATVVLGPEPTLRTLLGDHDACVGPTVSINAAAMSFDRARRLAALVTTGTIVRSGPLYWSDELATIIVHASPDATEELAARRLGPLHDPSPQRAVMLRETLAAWLDHPHQPRAIAGRLHLHPQTVHYRLARLRERLGDDLDDPQARFEFALALRYRPS